MTVSPAVENQVPAMLQQKKLQEVEEQHSQLCMLRVSCLLRLDPVIDKYAKQTKWAFKNEFGIQCTKHYSEYN